MNYYYTLCEKKDIGIYEINIEKDKFMKILNNLNKHYKYNKNIVNIYINNGYVIELDNNNKNMYTINSKFNNIVEKNNLLFMKEKRDINLLPMEQIYIYKDMDEEYKLQQYIYCIDTNSKIFCNFKTTQCDKIYYYIEIMSSDSSILDKFMKYL
tara:strand:- start:365 stop:826 length:462 start_codon:yes stop_codon:yes gene_type:complete